MKNRFIVILSFVLCFNFVFLQPLAMANTATMGGWSQVGDAIRQGATSIYNGTKTVVENGKNVVKNGVATVTPKVADVSKNILKGGGKVAVAYAVTELIGQGVDYVLDPANNSIRYTANPPFNSQNINDYEVSVYGGLNYATIDDACRAVVSSARSGATFTRAYTRTGVHQNAQVFCDFVRADGQNDYFSIGVLVLKEGEKRLPIDVVAAQVISNAEKGHEDSKVYVGSIADVIATPQEKESQWENTKAPAVPTTGANTANPANTNTNAKDNTNTANPPDTANSDKPSDKPFELPSFCGWATIVCDTAQNIKDWAKSVQDAYNSEIPQPKDTELDIQPYENNRPNTNVAFGGACPVPRHVNVAFAGINTDIEFSFDSLCSLATMLKPVIVSLASFSAVLIIAGVRDED